MFLKDCKAGRPLPAVGARGALLGFRTVATEAGLGQSEPEERGGGYHLGEGAVIRAGRGGLGVLGGLV